MAKGLTDKQRTILSLVERYWREHGSAPSVAEIAGEVGVSKPTAHAHLLALKKKGFLVHTEGRGRSWRPMSVGAGCQVDRIPLVGRVAAGEPILARQNIEGWIAVEGKRESEVLFGLRVHGDSMVNAGILDGDVVIVRKQDTAEPGEIVLVLVDEEDATVKRLRRRGRKVVLQPENTEMEPIEVAARRVKIQGKVVGVHRDLET